jgi:cytoskeletal protein RodZ
MQTLAFFQQHVTQQLVLSPGLKRSLSLLLVVFAVVSGIGTTWAASASTPSASTSGTSSNSGKTGSQTNNTGSSSTQNTNQNNGQNSDPNSTTPADPNANGTPADGTGTGNDKPAQFPLPPVEIQPHQPIQNREPIQPRQ